MEFNPNKPAQVRSYFWATYVPDRSAKFKMHSQRGHALNAFHDRDNAILYEWDKQAEEWIERYRIEDFRKPIDVCEVCGKDMPHNYYRGPNFQTKWINGPSADRKFVRYCAYRCGDSNGN